MVTTNQILPEKLTWPMTKQDENLKNIEFEPRMNQRQQDATGDNGKDE